MPTIKKLTKSEKWSIGLSILAVIVAITTPIFTYYWLDPQLQAFKQRGRLQISSPEETSIRNLDNHSPKMPDQFVGDGNDIIIPIAKKDWNIEILNIGNLPAKDVQLVFRYFLISKDEPIPTITFDPPSQAEINKKNDDIFVTIKKPIPPQEKITVNISKVPDEVWVNNEYGETSSIKTANGFVQSLERFGIFWGKPLATPTPKK